MAKLSENKIAWAAGFFDGEGCIQISRFRTDRYTFGVAHKLHVIVTQKERKPLEDFKRMFGGSVSINRSTDTYLWQVSNLHADKFLKLVQKYLVCKKDESKIGRKFIKLLKGNNEKITLKNLKQRDGIYGKLKQIKRKKYGR